MHYREIDLLIFAVPEFVQAKIRTGKDETFGSGLLQTGIQTSSIDLCFKHHTTTIE